MIKLKNILTEVINSYSVVATLISRNDTSITSILDQIRGLEKVTIVSNITPEEWVNKSDTEFTKIKMKFVTRGNPKEDVIKFKKDMLTSDLKTSDMRIDGLKNVKFKIDTLKRL
jgi:ABC-type sulfate/molybdate transport systems ATPase subunit